MANGAVIMKKWLTSYSVVPLSNESFQEILNFYLFECPCETKKYIKKEKQTIYSRVSMRGKTLRQRGWVSSHLSSLLAKMKYTSSKQLIYQHFQATENILSKIESAEKDSSLADPDFEMIVMAERSDMPLTSAVFYYIRNALAHGSFSVNGQVYCFESSKDGKIKAAIRLREKTLLNWITDVSLSPAELKQALQDEQTNTKKKRKKAA